MDEAMTGGLGIRFGGHQSFALRIAWLPKAVAAIEAGMDPLTDPISGVVELGLGKNMVEALRCWIEAYGVAHRAAAGGWELSEEGSAIFGEEGFDQYLEDTQTLWWLHWTIATRTAPRFFAWELLINRWSEPEFTASQAVDHFLRQADTEGRRLSPISARQHFDVWLQTYLAGRTGRGEEGLDSPLASLRLISVAGDRERDDGRREPVYRFDRNPRSSLSQAMLRYAIATWWDDANVGEETTALSQLTYGRASPGRVFRIQEAEMRERMAMFDADPKSGFTLRESVNQLVVRRTRVLDRRELLQEVFDADATVEAGLVDA